MRKSFHALSASAAIVTTVLALGCIPAVAAGFDGLLPPPPAAVRHRVSEQPAQPTRPEPTAARRVEASVSGQPTRATNPFASADLAAMLRQCRDVRIDGGARATAVLTRTGDHLALGDLADRALMGRLEDGTWVVALPFLDRANAQHSVVVLAWLADGPRYIGGLSAAGDHLSLNVARTIDVDFFRTPSNGRTLAAGGAPPSSSLHLAIIDGKLAASTAPVVASAQAVASTVSGR